MKMTLLEMTQDILSDMDSDEVNSINDTVESLQVAGRIRTSYFELLTTLNIPEKNGMFKLESVSDVTRPNYLKMPDGVKNVKWLRYNDKPISYMAPHDFILRLAGIEDGLVVIDPISLIEYSIKNDEDPRYWTSFDDTYLAFNSYNAANETTMQNSRSLGFGEFYEPFELDDDFVPRIDDNLFPLLLSEAKAACFVNQKQVSNVTEAKNSRRQLVRIQNELSRAGKGRPIDRLPNYGRNR